jgi:hypothetical protein
MLAVTRAANAAQGRLRTKVSPFRVTVTFTLNTCATVAGAASAAKGMLCRLWWRSALTLQALHVLVGCVSMYMCACALRA